VLSQPFLAEALYGGRNGEEFHRMEDALRSSLRTVAAGGRTWALVFDAMRAMASRHAAYHRLLPVDYLIAALAHENAIGVLHYDHDYDRLATDSGLALESVWLAEPGSLAEGTIGTPLRPWRNALNQGIAQVDDPGVYEALLDTLDRELDARGLVRSARP
jgi:predicted nucleic acid-binding protein